MSVSPGKHELRAYVPEAAYRWLKANCGAQGMGEFIGDVCLYYQKQAALDARLDRIEHHLFELLDRKEAQP